MDKQNFLFALLILLSMFGMYMVAMYFKLKANCRWLSSQHKEAVDFYEGRISELEEDLRCAVADLNFFKRFLTGIRDHFGNAVHNSGRLKERIDAALKTKTDPENRVGKI
jgi:hypothetical protein